MAKAPRRPSKTKPGGPPPPAARPARVVPAASAAPPATPGARRSPADAFEARLREPDEGFFLRGVERRVPSSWLLKTMADVGTRIVEVLSQHGSPALFGQYEALEFDMAEARERAAFDLGYEHGAADGRAEALRARAPGLGQRARRLADRARALVVNEGLSPRETTALLLETAWVLLFATPARSRARSGRPPGAAKAGP